MNDISVFMHYDAVRTMSIVTNQGKVWTISKTAVTNQGKVWTISKTAEFDFAAAKESMSRAIAKSSGNKDRAIEIF